MGYFRRMKRLLLFGLCASLLSACNITTPPGAQKYTIMLKDGPASTGNKVDLVATIQGTDKIKEVVFKRDGQELGRDNTAPYNYLDQVPSSGTYNYEATAFINDATQTQVTAKLSVTLNLPAELKQLSGTMVEVESLDHPIKTNPWKSGAGQLNLLNQSGTTLTSAAVATNGQFKLELPDLAQKPDLLVNAVPEHFNLKMTGCINDPQRPAQSNNPQAKIAIAEARIVAAGMNRDAAPFKVLEPTIVDNQVKVIYAERGSLIYADRAVTLDGTLLCGTSNPQTQISLKLPLTKGWNKITNQTTFNVVEQRLEQWIYSKGFAEGADVDWLALPNK